jgi:hypothetical protein
VITSLFILATGLDKEHSPLKLFFLMVGLINIPIMINGLIAILDASGMATVSAFMSNTVYPVAVNILRITIGIVMIMFISDVISVMSNRRKLYLESKKW